ncbi:MAG: sugar ABC transporter ATP-binding protein [Polyangiaceae bacterium]
MGIPDGREPVLEARGLIKRFAGVVALRGVDFDLRPGEVHALCGENGAGKSTLIKTLSGIHPHGSYEGDIVMGGAVQRFSSITDSERVGLSVIHQELALVPEMTVAENVFLGHEPRRFGLVDHDRMIGDTDELLSRWGINVSASAQIADLGVGQRQLVEIAKALRKESKVLILDEPSAALTDKEVAVLLDIVRELRSRGVSSVYISHRLEEVFALSDRITVLRDGQTVITLDTDKTDRGAIIAHMVGRPMDNLFPRRPSTPGQTLLSVKGLSVAERAGQKARLSNISFELRQGEVLGIGGLMGAGRSELLMHLFGIWGKRLAGSVQLEKAPLADSPAACIEQGLVLVTEDRKRYGLVLDQTVGFNLSLSAITEFSPNGFVDRDREVKKNAEYVGSLRIKASSQETIARTLSGGNQQKIVLGKALMTKPKVVLLDEPTRGIDVGAKFEIYELINDLKAQGVAVLLVSSELPELIGMSDRIMMLAEGRIGGAFEGSQITQEALLAAAMRPSQEAAPAAQEVA